MAKYQIIDGFLPTEIHNNLKSAFFSGDFPWYFTTNITAKNDVEGQDERNWYKFYHLFYRGLAPKSQAYELLIPLIERIKPLSLIEVRAFLTTYTGKKVNHGYHVDAVNLQSTDVEKHLKSCVYYVNSNNGGTQFETGEFVNSVENRALIFPQEERHAAVTAEDVSSRVVINFLYL